MVNQVSQQAAIRRYQDNLVVLGTGVIAFGVWALIKAIMLGTVGYQHYQAMLASSGTIEFSAVSYITLIVASLIELAFRVYVGRRARAEGMGQKTGHGYLFLVGLMILVSTLVLVMSVVSLVHFESSPFDTLITFSIELTSLLLLIMLIYSAVKLRRITSETS